MRASQWEEGVLGCSERPPRLFSGIGFIDDLLFIFTIITWVARILTTHHPNVSQNQIQLEGTRIKIIRWAGEPGEEGLTSCLFTPRMRSGAPLCSSCPPDTQVCRKPTCAIGG